MIPKQPEKSHMGILHASSTKHPPPPKTTKDIPIRVSVPPPKKSSLGIFQASSTQPPPPPKTTEECQIRVSGHSTKQVESAHQSMKQGCLFVLFCTHEIH